MPGKYTPDLPPTPSQCPPCTPCPPCTTDDNNYIFLISLVIASVLIITIFAMFIKR